MMALDIWQDKMIVLYNEFHDSKVLTPEINSKVEGAFDCSGDKKPGL